MLKLSLSSKKAPREESRVRALLWPDLGTRPGIDSVIDIGGVTAFAVAVIILLIVLFRLAPTAALIDAVLYAGFGFGIGRKSRACAILALILYLGSQISAYFVGRGSWNIVLVVIVTFLFINSVRGTFAHHRFVKKVQIQKPPVSAL
jgi:hypothetical protein